MTTMNSINRQHPLYKEDVSRIVHMEGVEHLKGKRFLITGATGLIGVFLIDVLMQLNRAGAEIHVRAVGRSREKAAMRLGEYLDDHRFSFFEQDVYQSLMDVPACDYIIPLASNTHPLAYSQYPIETIETNVKGAEQALQKAVECGATVLYPSSVEVYGNVRDAEAFDEEATGMLNLANARACYTESKRLSEALCQSYIAERQAKVKIVRLSRVFGPTMLMSDSKASSQFIRKALSGEDIVLKSSGEQLYSYTYVADAVGALLYVLVNGENGKAYNISNEYCNVRLKDFASLCAEWAETRVVFDAPSEAEQKGYSIAMNAVLDNSRLRNLGWQAEYTMKEAVNRTLTIMSES